MFTGIVSALGRVVSIKSGPVTRFEISAPFDAASVQIGASIAHAGVCLTVVTHRAEGTGVLYAVEAVPETLAKTTLGSLTVGDLVNLERPLRAGDELGGHVVQGHVDGVGDVVAYEPEGGGWRLTIRPPEELLPFIAEKGSITVDGASLTVASVEDFEFDIAIIPHTAEVTTLGKLKAGHQVNLEIDVLARYVARILALR